MPVWAWIVIAVLTLLVLALSWGFVKIIGILLHLFDDFF